MIVNGNFETGALTNWSSIGQAGVNEGKATITNEYGSAPDIVVENFLNLNTGTLDGLTQPFNATTGSAIQSSAFEVKAGKIMSFDWEFKTHEALNDSTFNDFSFFSVDSLSEAGPGNAYLLADTFGAFGSQTSTYNFKTGGYYQVGFGVMNQGDTAVISQLDLDNIKILNTDFETADFSDWSAFGNTSVQETYNNIAPTEGFYQAVLSSDTGAVSDASLETSLGLSTGALDSLGNGNATEGSAIKLTQIDVNVGDTLSFDWEFLTDEFGSYYNNYNDFSFVSIVGENGSTLYLDTLESVNMGVTAGYETFSYTFGTSGSFTVSVGVMDVADTSVTSTLLVDNLLLL